MPDIVKNADADRPWRSTVAGWSRNHRLFDTGAQLYIEARRAGTKDPDDFMRQELFAVSGKSDDEKITALNQRAKEVRDHAAGAQVHEDAARTDAPRRTPGRWLDAQLARIGIVQLTPPAPQPTPLDTPEEPVEKTPEPWDYSYGRMMSNVANYSVGLASATLIFAAGLYGIRYAWYANIEPRTVYIDNTQLTPIYNPNIQQPPPEWATVIRHIPSSIILETDGSRVSRGLTTTATLHQIDGDPRVLLATDNLADGNIDAHLCTFDHEPRTSKRPATNNLVARAPLRAIKLACEPFEYTHDASMSYFSPLLITEFTTVNGVETSRPKPDTGTNTPGHLKSVNDCPAGYRFNNGHCFFDESNGQRHYYLGVSSALRAYGPMFAGTLSKDTASDDCVAPCVRSDGDRRRVGSYDLAEGHLVRLGHLSLRDLAVVVMPSVHASNIKARPGLPSGSTTQGRYYSYSPGNDPDRSFAPTDRVDVPLGPDPATGGKAFTLSPKK